MIESMNANKIFALWKRVRIFFVIYKSKRLSSRRVFMSYKTSNAEGRRFYQFAIWSQWRNKTLKAFIISQWGGRYFHFAWEYPPLTTNPSFRIPLWCWKSGTGLNLQVKIIFTNHHGAWVAAHKLATTGWSGDCAWRMIRSAYITSSLLYCRSSRNCFEAFKDTIHFILVAWWLNCHQRTVKAEGW